MSAQTIAPVIELRPAQPLPTWSDGRPKSHTAMFPRPLRVQVSELAVSDPVLWFCRKCEDAGVDIWREGSGAAGWAPSLHEANSAARSHWNRCPHTDAALQRIMAAVRELGVAGA